MTAGKWINGKYYEIVKILDDGTFDGIIRLTAQQPFSGTGSTNHTFSKEMQGFCIVNDGSADLTFTIGSDTYTVKSKETFNEYFKPFTVVDIVATGAFRSYGLGV